VYIYVYIRYRVTELLLNTVMSVRGTGWGKYYCVHLCVYEVQGDGNTTEYSDVSEVEGGVNVTVYSDLFLTYIVVEILLRTLMCV